MGARGKQGQGNVWEKTWAPQQQSKGRAHEASAHQREGRGSRGDDGRATTELHDDAVVGQQVLVADPARVKLTRRMRGET